MCGAAWALDGRFEMYGEDYKKLRSGGCAEDLRALYVKSISVEHNGTQRIGRSGTRTTWRTRSPPTRGWRRCIS
ncbi:MAG: hypothetical protein ACLUI3_07935 [Christensenellales bacterium]